MINQYPETVDERRVLRALRLSEKQAERQPIGKPKTDPNGTLRAQIVKKGRGK